MDSHYLTLCSHRRSSYYDHNSPRKWINKMNGWLYFLAGILLMIAIDAGWLFIRLHRRIANQSQRISELEQRINRIDEHNPRSRLDYSYNTKAALETMALDIVIMIDAVI